MIKAIFFDFDGVIVESTDIKTEAFARLFEPEGANVVKKVVAYHIGNMGVSRFDKFRFIYKEILHRELNDNEFDMLCKKFACLVVNAVIDAPYVKGAKEFLERESAAYAFFVVSATPQDEIVDIVRRRGLAGLFKFVYGAPLTKSEAVRRTLREENILPGNTVYVGDAMSDYLAAKDNGVKFIARINENKEIFAGIDCLKIADLSGLTPLLASL
ncbi:MAG: HAD hydrolase-like protein [Candidatus Omnitrophica bacterium]|nr:HAD hydrolase-like protein [Candidatus Omnitrophota bacterium]